MSAAGLGPRAGGAHDVYQTPAWAVERLLERYRPPLGVRGWFEPAAGDGGIMRAVDAAIGARGWTACEIRRECEARLIATGAVVLIDDFITQSCWRGGVEDVRVIITNPPYSLAEAFVRRSREFAPRADLVMLLRQGFLSSSGRAQLYREIGVPDLYVLPDRPDFLGTGGNDSADYAWFVWPREVRRRGTIEMLDVTPLAVRRPVKVSRNARFPNGRKERPNGSRSAVVVAAAPDDTQQTKPPPEEPAPLAKPSAVAAAPFVSASGAGVDSP